MLGHVHSRPNVTQGPAKVRSVVCRKREIFHPLPSASAIWTHNLLVILPLVLSTGIASLQTILGKIGKPAPMSLGPTPGVSKLIMLNEKGKIVYKRKNHIYCIYQFVIRA
jgi:hypothetical protein